MAFTVSARMIYDNMHDIDGQTGVDPVTGLSRVTDVLQEVRARMTAHGFSADRVTYSVQGTWPSRCGMNCGSIYGDSAMLMLQSELTAAVAGGYFGYPASIRPPIGYPAWAYGLPCQTDQNTEGMMYLPGHYSYTQPQMVDIHTYIVTEGYDYQPAYASACTAWTFYNALWTFLGARQRTTDYVVFGETLETQPALRPQCYQPPVLDWTYASVRGFMASSLRTRPTPNEGTVFRVWNDLLDGPRKPLEEDPTPDLPCRLAPNRINPPYKP